MDNKHKITVGKRLVNKLIGKSWRDVNLDFYRVIKPVVLVLGGDGTRDNRRANGNAKIIESLLGVFDYEVDILAANYNMALESKDSLQNEYKKLVDKIFIPCVSRQGERISLDRACKNIRNFTISTHCFGDYEVLNSMIKIFEEQLFQLGYENNEIDKIISQIFVVGYGSKKIGEIKKYKSLYCTSFSDEVCIDSAINSKFRLLKNLDKIKMTNNDRNELSKIEVPDYRSNSIGKMFNEVDNFFAKRRRVFQFNRDNQIELLTYGLYQSGGHVWEADHSMSGLTRSEYWKLWANSTPIKDTWKKSDYASSTGDCVSKCFACAICNSVANSMQNLKSKELIEFDMTLLQEQIDNICQEHNYKMSAYDEIDLEEHTDKGFLF